MNIKLRNKYIYLSLYILFIIFIYMLAGLTAIVQKEHSENFNNIVLLTYLTKQ